LQVSAEILEKQREAVGRAWRGEFLRYDVEIYGQASGEGTIIIDYSLITSLGLQYQIQRRGIRRSDPRMLSPERIEQLTALSEKFVTRLTRLVNDILDTSRIRSGRLRLEKAEVDLEALVKEVLDRTRPLFVDAGCGEPVLRGCPARGEYHPLRIEQVFTSAIT
jgi:signal transduction histidine kinase